MTTQSLPRATLAQTYLDAQDKRFHESSGIRLPDLAYTAEQHRSYDKTAWDILYAGRASSHGVVVWPWALVIPLALAGLLLSGATLSQGLFADRRNGANSSEEEAFSYVITQTLYH